MALSKKDLQEIGNIFDERIKLLSGGGRRKAKEWIKLTKKRLYAYPLLKSNIERYKADIEDIKLEDLGKSKSIVIFTANSGGEKPTLEELREAKIMLIERKIARDEAEIKEMTAALDTIRGDYYFPIIEMMFFQKMRQEDIAASIPCDKTTVWRQAGRLIDTLCTTLYGADALAI